MKKYLYFIIGTLFFAGIAYAAPTYTYQTNLLPLANDTYDLGSTSPALEWKNLYAKNITLTGTCTGCGTGSPFPFTPSTNYNATSTVIGFLGGLFSNSSTTLNGTINFPGITDKFLSTDVNGKVFGTATTSLNLPNTALQNSSFSTSYSGGISGDSVVNLGGTFTLRIPAWPFTAQTWGNSTSSILSFAGFMSSASSTITGSTTILGQLTLGTASTSANNGVNLTDGCFSIGGTCLQTLIGSASAYKQAVKYASTSTLPSVTYSNGTGGVGATLTGVANGPLFIDGNTTALGDRILVKNESTGANNGIYTVTTLGVALVSPFVLTRATDYNSSLDVFPGVANFTNSGTVNANTCWILTNTTAITIGTTALTYADECGAGSFAATAPINLSGTTFSLNTGGGLDISGSNLVAQVSTSTVPNVGGLAYWTGAGTPSSLGTVATGTITGSTGLSVTAGQSIIGSGLTITNTGVTSNVAGNGISLNTTTGAVTITNTIGYPFVSNATSTLINFSTGLASASTTLTGNFIFVTATGTSATTTSLSVTGYASTTALTVSNIRSALIVTGAGGAASAYSGASSCSANNFFTGLSALGASSCGTASVTVNGVSIALGASGIVSSTTLLGDLNIFSSLDRFTGGLLVNNASTTISGNLFVDGNGTTTNATSTNLFATTASSTKLFGANLQSCNSASSALTYNAGTFGCNSITSAAFSYPFAVNGLSTTSPIELLATTTIGAGGVTTGLTVNGTATTTNFINLGVTSALASFNATHQEGAYAGSNPCSAGTQAAFSLSAAGVITCASVDTFAWPFTANSTYNSTSTALGIFASTTIGSGTQIGGLTISGGSTTTLTAVHIASVGIGTSSPTNALTLDRTGGLATSSILVFPYTPATSTAMNVDCKDSNTIHISLGTGATTLTLKAMTAGQACKIIISNPAGTAGTITWTAASGQPLYWAGGSAPSQTTTAYKRDVYSFIADVLSATATSTSGVSILGAQTANF